MRRRFPFLVVFFLAFVCSVSTGCGEKLDPTDPEGAYNLYVKSLWAGDAEAVWDRLAPSTKEYFQDEYDTLVGMDETIRRYLPPTDHRIAREQAGSILTDDVKDGKGLFLKVFQPSRLKLTESHRVGASVEEIRINEDETVAELKTLGGDTFYITKGDDEQWYVMLVRSSSMVEERMKWLDSNQSALKQTVEDLIDEERKEREEVIAELMKLETDGRQEEDSGDNGD
jgi:hypothetical protein